MMQQSFVNTDSLLVFKIDQEHSFTNDLDLNDWLEDIHNESAISL